MAIKKQTQLDIRALEERLANPAADDTREQIAGLFADGFREIGSSGRVFDVNTVLGAIGGAARSVGRGAISFEGFRTERVAPNVVLATYIARVAPGPGWRPPTLRSSLWCQRGGRWQIVFHQGTPLAADARPSDPAVTV
jgi:hypothetical protein